MSVTTENGRLCNQIIRNICVSLVAEKHSLNIQYSSYDRIQKLGIPLFIGTHSHVTTVLLTDTNLLDILNSDTFTFNIDANNDFFQTKDISNYLFRWFRKQEIQNIIMNINPFKERYLSNNDCFVHIRLTDVADWNPGIAYYIKAINSLTYDKLYIGTDEPTHSIIQDLVKTYPDLEIVKYNEIETIQFASTNKYIILSHGSYSTVIGYLSFFSQVYYPMYEVEKQWYGDTFSIPSWNKIHF